MDVRLKVCIGSNSGQELRIPGPKFLIGRAEDCHLRPKSDLISRHHCVLLVDENGFTVRDLGSRNGTLVNDERITGECELLNGDRLKVGPLEFEVVLTPLAAPQKRPKVTSIADAAARTAEGRHTESESDLSQWLTDDVRSAEPTVPEAETREIESVDTEEIKLGATTMNLPPMTFAKEEPPAKPKPVHQPPMYQPEVEAKDAEQTEDLGSTTISDASPKGKCQPGKLPPIKRTTDSRAAANDVLKKFFNRR